MELGLDGSFTSGQVVSVEWFKRRRAEGYQVWAQCAWTGGFAGNDGIRAVASGNLLNAEAAGLKIMAYANASPPSWWSLQVQMENIKANCGAAWPHVQLVPVDVELSGITHARVKELADALRAEGKNQAVEVLYSGRWFWLGHLGNDQSQLWLRWKLWNSHYDFNPDVDFGARPYGPWQVSDLVGEQYEGTTRLDGIDVDLNVFDIEMLFPETASVSAPTFPPLAEQTEGELTMGQYEELKALITAWEQNLNKQISDQHDWVQTNVHDALLGRLEALERKVASASPAPTPPAQKTYTVVSGDTLGDIAARYTGNSGRWTEIPNIPADVRADPRKLQAGTVLVIPW